MRIRVPPQLALGVCVGSVRPPAPCGVFFAKAALRLIDGEPAAWAEEAALVSGDVYADEDPTKSLRYPSDFVVFKPRTDLLLVGHAHAPGRVPTTGLRAGFAVGSFSKSVDVVAEPPGPLGVSSTKTFVSMPLGYELAYGGSGFSANPLGRGHADGGAPLIFSPGRPGAPEPAGFGPIPPAWPQRQSLVGSYKGNYMSQRWPWFPEDFDWGYFNAAPRDQQVDGYLVGDEEVVLVNLDADHPVLRSRLPGVRVRCFVSDRSADGAERFREARMRLDTLWIDADSLTLVLVWRGLLEVQTPKMRELEDITIALEPLADQPRPQEEYRAAALPPAAAKSPDGDERPAEPDAADEALEAQFAALDGQFVAIEQQLSATEKELTALASVPRDLAANSAIGAAKSADGMDALATALREAAEGRPEQALVSAVDVGVFDEARAELAALKAEMAALEAEFGATVQAAREDLAALAASGESFADLNLAGLDLSGLDLAGRDLSGVHATRASFAGADLSGACLRGADLSKANFEGADLTGAVLDRADLTGASLAGAKLTGLSLNQTRLVGLELAAADLSGSTGKEANFSKANLAGAQFVGARLPAVDFDGANLTDAVFRGAGLPSSRFHGAVAPRIDLSEADLQGVQADEGADFSGARFGRSNAAKGVFDGSNLDGADLRQGNFSSAQFEGTSLRGANFDRANLTDAMLEGAVMHRAIVTNANLLRVSFQGADLAQATFEGANLFEAGLWLAKTEQAMLRGANCKSTLAGRDEASG